MFCHLAVPGYKYAHPMTQCSTLGVYPKETLTQAHKGTQARMSSKSFFVVVGSWKQSRWDQVLGNLKSEFSPNPYHRGHYPFLLAKTDRKTSKPNRVLSNASVYLMSHCMRNLQGLITLISVQGEGKWDRQTLGLFILQKGKS